MAGPTETPPHTQANVGVGDSGNRAARSCDLSHDRVARSRDNNWAEWGGTHRLIGHVTQASSEE